MELTLTIKKTASGYLVSGAVDGKPIDPDVASTARQAANLVKRVVGVALGLKDD